MKKLTHIFYLLVLCCISNIVSCSDSKNQEELSALLLLAGLSLGNNEGSSGETTTNNAPDSVSIVESSGNTQTTEGGATDTYSVVLISQPSASVTINVTPDSQTRINGGNTSAALIFTTANWDVAQNINVEALNDVIVEGSHTSTISHSATSADNNYNNISIKNVTINITDTNIGTLSDLPDSASTAVTEGGTTDTFRVRLPLQPSITTVIKLYPLNNQLNLGAGDGVPVNLTFTTINWNVYQQITVTAIDDVSVEGAHNGGIAVDYLSGPVPYTDSPEFWTVINITDND